MTLQDVQLNAVRTELSDLLSKSSETQQRLDESVQHIQLLKDQNALLKAQKGTSFQYLIFAIGFLVFTLCDGCFGWLVTLCYKHKDCLWNISICILMYWFVRWWK